MSLCETFAMHASPVPGTVPDSTARPERARLCPAGESKGALANRPFDSAPAGRRGRLAQGGRDAFRHSSALIGLLLLALAFASPARGDEPADSAAPNPTVDAAVDVGPRQADAPILLAAANEEGARESASTETPVAEEEVRRRIVSHLSGFRRAAEQLLIVCGSAFWLALLPLIGISLLILVILSAPILTQRTLTGLRESRMRSFFLGLIDLAFLLFACAVLAHSIGPLGHLLALLALAGGTLMALLGITAACEDVGQRALLLGGREGTRATRILAGVPIAFYASVVPLFGWFVVFPVLFVSGFGAAVMACWPGKRSPTPAPATLPPVAPSPPPEAGSPTSGGPV